MLPMLSGLFGVSLLFVNLGRGISMPKQRIAEVIELKWKELLKPVSLSVLSGSLVSIFPALGPAQSAAIATRLFGKGSSYAYLVLLGGINTVSMLMGLITMYTIGKARNGSIEAVHEMLQNVSASHVFALLAASMVAGCISVFLTLLSARFFAAFVSRINYRLLCLAVICAVAAMVLLFSGITGIVVLLTATAIGLLPIIKGVGRSNAMGCLIVPVIIYYLV
ncbi:tripartite tricarboxylate transporter permease [Candidatus Woesearchaeota archaeon]|nr:tripartite tricarboxylate transporter permease [Candidatus Woesearchaeota archaeon]